MVNDEHEIGHPLISHNFENIPVQFTAKQCPTLPDIANGYYDYTYCSDSSLQRTFGVRCKAQCKRGYSLTERVEWTCDHGGYWTNNSQVASCEGMLL